MNLIIYTIVFLVMVFVFWSAIAYWLEIYDRGQERLRRQRR